MFEKEQNERRDFYDLSECRESAVKVHECDRTNNNYMKCPYCGYEDFDLFEDGGLADAGEWDCRECETPFSYEVVFLEGITTFPIDCNEVNAPHRYRFQAQYHYSGKYGEHGNVRISCCIDCGNQTYDKFKWDMLPWHDQYNDPDYFDPSGILKTSNSYVIERPTPVLRLLDRCREKGIKLTTSAIERALNEHSTHYSD